MPRDKTTSQPWRRRLLHIGLAAALVSGLSWVATWVYQRSLNSPRKTREFVSWLEDNLNTDISNLNSPNIRINILRDSRLTVSDLEIEHPNVIFPGRFISLSWGRILVPPMAWLGLWPVKLEALAEGLNLLSVENDAGEWSLAMFMRPLSATNTAFPYPLPKISGCSLNLSNSSVTLRRRGYDLRLEVNAAVDYNRQNGRVALESGVFPFTITNNETGAESRGSAKTGPMSAWMERMESGALHLIPEHCEIDVDNFPIAALPFLLRGVPTESLPGAFFGKLRLSGSGTSADPTRAIVNGMVKGAPLGILGLPPESPLQIDWPIDADNSPTTAIIHMGPAGFGGVDFRVPFDDRGIPVGLETRGDLAVLDDMPFLFARHSRWAEWLTRVFPSMEWYAAKWLAFGWSGAELRLNLSRSLSGLNLSGTAKLLGGAAKFSMTPEQGRVNLTVAAEAMDAPGLAQRFSRYLAESWVPRFKSGAANLNWRGGAVESGFTPWGMGIVVMKPVVDLEASGDWWKRLAELPSALADKLDAWGGGDAKALRAMAAEGEISMNQISLVTAYAGEDSCRVEFAANGGRLGSMDGWIETMGEGRAAGEIYLSGQSAMLMAAAKANPRFGRSLAMMANTSEGLRISFTHSPDRGSVFSYPFLDDAARLDRTLEQGKENAP